MAFFLLCYHRCVWQRVAVREGVRAVRHGRVFVKHVMPAVVKPAMALWNQVIGFIFLCFAILLGFRAASLAKQDHLVGVLFCGFGALLTLWYGVSSFLKARRISRS